MKVQVSDIIFNEKGIPPVIVTFANGKLLEGKEFELKSEVLNNKNHDKVLAIASDRMLYTGKIGSNKELNNNFILVHNRKSNSVRLVNVENVVMRPYFKKSSELLENSSINRSVTTSELNKQFGSKRTKQKTEQQERLKIDIENVREQLEQTVAAITTDDDFLNAPKSNENVSSYRPPIDRNASTKETVYILENLVPQNILDGLEEEAKTVFANIQEDKSELRLFCKSNIQKLENLNSLANLQKCEIFLYINYLIKFLGTAARAIQRRFIICDSSPDVNFHILDNFSVVTGGNRTRPLSMRDKSICYILVLATLASDYETNLESLAKDIKIGMKKLQEMARVLGFSIVGENKIALKLPLPQPFVPTSKRKRK